ncbi:hypothetical protein [Myroides odoratimimus]|uniref:Uncharacterized protein n=1 Tax=Myroides odoratimimus CIP 101113 TaxID=883154 RepID=A0AAV3F532_9FLAO|nr:hypothetical protein [Myroides odoratimimus]EHO13850.1 hypothetical protein HMPREF9715_00924 [Myroides odoratimimus CIP 101113]
MADIVRGSLTLSVVKKADSLTMRLIAPIPLVAKYSNDSIFDSWTDPKNHREVYVQCLSAISSFPLSVNVMSQRVWKWNGQVIDEKDSRFEFFNYTIGSVQVPALRIKADIMNGINTASFIEFSAKISSGGFEYSMHSNIEVNRESVSPNTYRSYILDQNNRGAVITQSNQTVTLVAILEKGGREVMTGLSYQWSKVTLDSKMDLLNDNVADFRMTIPGATAKTYTVTRDQVDTTAMFQCEIKENGIVVGSAMIEVRDETDPLDILYETNIPFDAVDEEQTLIVTPKVVIMGTSTSAPGTWTYSYQKAKMNGTNIGAKATGAKYNISYEDINSNGSNILLFIEAKN